MILASQKSVVKYTNLGIWSEKTLIDYFKSHVKETSDRICIVDPYDREKDIIVRGGSNISAQEIENYIFSHVKVKDAAVVSMPDERLGERVCAYVVPVPGEQVLLSDLTALLDESGVAKYKWPERVEMVNVIPRNPVGKILKNVLREDIRRKMGN